MGFVGDTSEEMSKRIIKKLGEAPYQAPPVDENCSMEFDESLKNQAPDKPKKVVKLK